MAGLPEAGRKIPEKGRPKILITKLRVKIMPGAHILGFLLNPGDTPGVWVQCQGILELRLWKGVELFKSDDGDIFLAKTRALLLELVVDLAATQKNLIHPLIALYERIRDDTPESAHGTLVQGRDRFRITQKALGSEHHQGFRHRLSIWRLRQ